MYKSLKQSFTLVEVSIVLLIISLLTAAVLSTNSIITNARAQRTIQEINSYRQAINSFYQMHSALPGDYSNAQYELTPTACTLTNCETAEENIISTLSENIRNLIPLNGDANGKVSYAITGLSSLYKSEAFGVWSHLSAQNLISQKYSNTCKNISSNNRLSCLQAGYNLPKISAGYNTSSVYIFTDTANYNSDIYGQIFDISYNPNFTENYHALSLVDISHKYAYGSNTDIGNYVHGGGGGITADIMLRIDAKIDDGKPLTGNVYGINGSNEDNKITDTLKVGQCNTYTGANSSFNINNNITRDKIIYSNNSNKTCIGVVIFNEFAS